MHEKILLILCLFLVSCSAVTDGNNGNKVVYPRPNLEEAYKKLDVFIKTVPLQTSFRSLELNSTKKTNDDVSSLDNSNPKNYVMQFHLDVQNGVLVENGIFYIAESMADPAKDPIIQSHTVRKLKLEPLADAPYPVTIQKVNDNYRVLPKSFYEGYTLYGAHVLYYKFEQSFEPYSGEQDCSDYIDEKTGYSDYYAVKVTEDSYSFMRFNGHSDGEDIDGKFQLTNIVFLHNGMEDSIDESLERWGTTPDQAGNILLLGEMDIPHLEN